MGAAGSNDEKHADMTCMHGCRHHQWRDNWRGGCVAAAIGETHPVKKVLPLPLARHLQASLEQCCSVAGARVAVLQELGLAAENKNAEEQRFWLLSIYFFSYKKKCSINNVNLHFLNLQFFSSQVPELLL